MSLNENDGTPSLPPSSPHAWWLWAKGWISTTARCLPTTRMRPMYPSFHGMHVERTLALRKGECRKDMVILDVEVPFGLIAANDVPDPLRGFEMGFLPREVGLLEWICGDFGEGCCICGCGLMVDLVFESALKGKGDCGWECSLSWFVVNFSCMEGSCGVDVRGFWGRMLYLWVWSDGGFGFECALDWVVRGV